MSTDGSRIGDRNSPESHAADCDHGFFGRVVVRQRVQHEEAVREAKEHFDECVSEGDSWCFWNSRARGSHSHGGPVRQVRRDNDGHYHAHGNHVDYVPGHQAECVFSRPPYHPCPPQRPVLQVDQGRIWGDPHFIGEDGGEFDIMGEPGMTYNLLSDTGIQVNGKFDTWRGRDGQTVITEMGITTLNGHQIKIEDCGAVSVDDRVLNVGESATLTDGSVVTNNGGTVQVTAGEWDLVVEVKGDHLNVDFRSDNAYSDGMLPDGLWGQTVDFDNDPRSAYDKQGNGAFVNPLSTYHSYEVGTGDAALFDTSFQDYNNYAGGNYYYFGPHAACGCSGLVPQWLSVPPGFYPTQPYIYAYDPSTGAYYPVMNTNAVASMPPQIPGQEQRSVLQVDQGRIWGDPHFIGEDGGEFDIMGEPGKTYNLLSDTGIQVNGKFDTWRGRDNQTVITEMGITTENGHQIKILDHGEVSVDGIALNPGESATLTDGSVVTNNGDTVQIHAGEWDLKVEMDGDHLNVDFRSDNAYSDGILPDGMWGQTVDFDNDPRAATDKQGTGAFYDPALSYQAYEVGGGGSGDHALFDTGFPNMNNFNGGNYYYVGPHAACGCSGLVPQWLSIPPGYNPTQPYIYAYDPSSGMYYPVMNTNAVGSMPPQIPGQEQRSVLQVDQGRIWGDPHFIGEDGGEFDIMGEPGKTYNLLSDTGIQVNGKFDTWRGRDNQTVITEMGITTENGHQIKILDHGEVTVDGIALNPGESATLTDGSVVTNNGDTVQIHAGEWDLKVEMDGDHLNVDFRSDNAYSDGILPDGMWGQTVDFDNDPRAATDKQGTGAFYDPALSYQAYEVGGGFGGDHALFDTNFPNMNNFNGDNCYYVGPHAACNYSGMVAQWLSIPPGYMPVQPYIYIYDPATGMVYPVPLIQDDSSLPDVRYNA